MYVCLTCLKCLCVTLQSDGTGGSASLDIENTLWTNTVVASGQALGLVVYTGNETRSAMNTSKPQMKVGLLDMEINTLTKLLFCMVLLLSIVMMLLKVRARLPSRHSDVLLA